MFRPNRELNMALPLYDIDPTYLSLTEVPGEAGEEDDSAAVETLLVAVPEDVGSKLLALAKVVRTLEAEADILEAHARDLVAGRA
jgi:hypothetical protein